MLPTKFGVNWPLGLGEEAKTRFLRWPPWSPRCFLLSLKSKSLSVQENRRKIDFQDCRLGFPIGTILAIFDL